MADYRSANVSGRTDRATTKDTDFKFAQGGAVGESAKSLNKEQQAMTRNSKSSIPAPCLPRATLCVANS
jgi:hypothetical protein